MHERNDEGDDVNIPHPLLLSCYYHVSLFLSLIFLPLSSSSSSSSSTTTTPLLASPSLFLSWISLSSYVQTLADNSLLSSLSGVSLHPSITHTLSPPRTRLTHLLSHTAVLSFLCSIGALSLLLSHCALISAPLCSSTSPHSLHLYSSSYSCSCCSSH